MSSFISFSAWNASKSNSNSKFQHSKLLKLQNHNPDHSFTDLVIHFRDGFFRIHSFILPAGSRCCRNGFCQQLPPEKQQQIRELSVEELSTALFLFYLEQSRLILPIGSRSTDFLSQADRILKAMDVDQSLVTLHRPLESSRMRGETRNQLLNAMSSSLDGLSLRFTRTENGRELGDYLISVNGVISPLRVPAHDYLNCTSCIGEPPASLLFPTPRRSLQLMDLKSLQHQANSTENPPVPMSPSTPPTSPDDLSSASDDEEDDETHGFVCRINECFEPFTSVESFLHHTNDKHKLFKGSHFRLRKSPQCLVCNRKSKTLGETLKKSPEDFTEHIYSCLQEELKRDKEWKPEFKPQRNHYAAVNGSQNWFEQLDDDPRIFTQDYYLSALQKRKENSWSEDSESDDDGLRPQMVDIEMLQNEFGMRRE